MTNDDWRWLWVIDHDRNRFAILNKPALDDRPWRTQIDTAAHNGSRRLSAGSTPLRKAPTRAEAAAAIRHVAPDAVQFSTHAILTVRQN